MLSDRELDALVAEKVLGREIKRMHADFFMRVPVDEEGWVAHSLVPQFSADIAAAFFVVEAMRAKGWRINVGPMCLPMEGGNDAETHPTDWTATISRARQHTPKVKGALMYARLDAASPARAICLAALRALGVEVDA